MNTVKLFVEGGGNTRELHGECRAGFSAFIKKAALEGRMPRIVACGSRNEAYEDYCTAVKRGEAAVLLVDSEAPVLIPVGDPEYNQKDIKTWKPWYHLKNRQGRTGEIADSWEKPEGVNDKDCHLMVELMEAWFLADAEALKAYYGKGFHEKSLPPREDIEEIPKITILNSLANATRNTSKGSYSKGDHSFKILRCINPSKVTDKSPWGNRFIELLSEKMS